MNTIIEPQKPKAIMNRETSILMRIAGDIPVLANKLGITHDETGRLKMLPQPRSWMVANPLHPEECRFDPDKFHRQMGVWSTGERFAGAFLLMVWNHGSAKSKGWRFDIIDAAGTLSGDNMAGIIKWLEHPIWP